MHNYIDTRTIVRSDNDPLFYKIPGFPGYEATKNGYVRSFKNKRNIYPYGYIIKCYEPTGRAFFRITNQNNQVVEITYQEILALIAAEPGHPYYEITFNNSRNKRMGIRCEEVKVGKLVKNHRPVRKDGQDVYLSDLFSSDAEFNKWKYEGD